MSPNFDRILEEALQLPDEERAALAELLQPHSGELSLEWEAEIDRRVAMEEAGEIEFRPFDELKARLIEKYGLQD